jgi:hypothetical protein
MQYVARTFLRIRNLIRPDVRQWIDGFGTVFAITLVFCLLQAVHDGIHKRNTQLDEHRWWYPIYKTLIM